MNTQQPITKEQHRIGELEAALCDAVFFLEKYADIVDGPDGPEPNEAMALMMQLTQALEG